MDEMTKTKTNVYEEITAQVVALLEEGTAPWTQPWSGVRELPRRINGEPYEGWNVFWLLVVQRRNGYESNLWLTRNKIEAKGGKLRKGAKPTEVIFWKPLTFTDTRDGVEVQKTVPLLRFYAVYNLDQTEGIANLPRWYREQAQATASDPIEAAEAIVAGYSTASYAEGGTRAYYQPSKDHIQMPPRAAFSSAARWYATRFHEMGHSTGHATRLKRASIMESGGDPDGQRYGEEELVAEMTAAFLCGHAGIAETIVRQSAAYLQGWIKAIKGNPRMVVTAAGKAQKAADLILGSGASAEAAA